MPTPVSVTPKSLEEYRPHVGDDVIAEIEELARPLRGARVLHLNSTAFGGGVAELQSIRWVSIESCWLKLASLTPTRLGIWHSCCSPRGVMTMPN